MVAGAPPVTVVGATGEAVGGAGESWVAGAAVAGAVVVSDVSVRLRLADPAVRAAVMPREWQAPAAVMVVGCGPVAPTGAEVVRGTTGAGSDGGGDTVPTAAAESVVVVPAEVELVLLSARAVETVLTASVVVGSGAAGGVLVSCAESVVVVVAAAVPASPGVG